MLVWVLFIAAYNVDAVSTQQMFFQDQSSCERVGKRFVQAANSTGQLISATYSCTQARIIR
jgi:hypothetical protein